MKNIKNIKMKDAMSVSGDFVSRLLENRRQAIVGGLLLVLILAMGGTFLYVAIQSAHDKEYITKTGELRVLSQNIVKNAAEASSARVEAFPLLNESRNQFDAILTNLQTGDAEKGTPPSPDAVAPQLESVVSRWAAFRQHADQILKAEGAIRQINEFVAHINNSMPNLLALSDEVVQIMIDIYA